MEDVPIQRLQIVWVHPGRTYLTGANVAGLPIQVRAKATDTVNDLGYLSDELDKAHQRLGIEAGDDDRLVIAEMRKLAETLSCKTANNVAVIDAMAAATACRSPRRRHAFVTTPRKTVEACVAPTGNLPNHWGRRRKTWRLRRSGPRHYQAVA